MKKLMVSVFAGFAAAVAFGGDEVALQALIDGASDGDVIQLEAKAYKLDAEVTLGKPITLKGAGRGKTVLDGQGKVRVLKISKAATVEDLTVANGTVNGNGAGVNVTSDGVTLRNVEVKDCVAWLDEGNYVYGGGLYSNKKNLLVDSCLFSCCVVSNNASSNARAYGGGLYCSGGAVIDSSVITGCCATVASLEVRGGGAAISGADVRLVNSTLAANSVTNYLNHNDWNYPGGGGLYVAGGAIASNNLVVGNICCGRGAGAYIEGAASVICDSTFTNNAMVGMYCGTQSGSGGGLSGNGGTVERCVFRGNSSAQGGSAIGWDGGRAALNNAMTVRNCLIENNAGVAVRLGASKKTLDRCVIRNNGDAGVKFVVEGNAAMCIGNLLTHCIFDGNAGRAIDSSSVDYVSGYSNVVRNCLFRGNKTTGSGLLALKIYTQPKYTDIGCSFVFENNTVVGNQAASGAALDTYWFPHPDKPTEYCRTRPVIVRNNIFADNAGITAEIQNYDQEKANIFATCCQHAANIPTDETSATGYVNGCKVVPEIADVKFVNAAANDYRPRGVSPCAKAGVAQGWMDGAYDLGDGTYAVAKSADWGVKIDFGKAKPRVSATGLVDMGAYANFTPGLLLLVK